MPPDDSKINYLQLNYFTILHLVWKIKLNQATRMGIEARESERESGREREREKEA